MGLTHVWAADIVKMHREEDGTLTVEGKAADPSVDLDKQICDPAWLKRAMPDWFAWGNIREQHQMLAAGVATDLDERADGHYVTAKIVDANTAKKVEAGVLKGFSIGIKGPRIVKDATAPGGRIIDGQIIEVSLVDRPANPNCKLVLAKAAGNDVAQVEELEEKAADGGGHSHDHGHDDGSHAHAHGHQPLPGHMDHGDGAPHSHEHDADHPDRTDANDKVAEDAPGDTSDDATGSDKTDAEKTPGDGTDDAGASGDDNAKSAGTITKNETGWTGTFTTTAWNGTTGTNTQQYDNITIQYPPTTSDHTTNFPVGTKIVLPDLMPNDGAFSEKVGRILSGANEGDLRNARDLIDAVLAKLIKEQDEEDAEHAKDSERDRGKGLLFSPRETPEWETLKALYPDLVKAATPDQEPVMRDALKAIMTLISQEALEAAEGEDESSCLFALMDCYRAFKCFWELEQIEGEVGPMDQREPSLGGEISNGDDVDAALMTVPLPGGVGEGINMGVKADLIKALTEDLVPAIVEGVTESTKANHEALEARLAKVEKMATPGGPVKGAPASTTVIEPDETAALEEKAAHYARLATNAHDTTLAHGYRALEAETREQMAKIAGGK